MRLPFESIPKSEGSKAIITICPFSLCESKPIDHESRTKERILCLYHYLNRWSLTVLSSSFWEEIWHTEREFFFPLSSSDRNHQVFLEKVKLGEVPSNSLSVVTNFTSKNCTQQTNVGPFWFCLPCLWWWWWWWLSVFSIHCRLSILVNFSHTKPASWSCSRHLITLSRLLEFDDCFPSLSRPPHSHFYFACLRFTFHNRHFTFSFVHSHSSHSLTRCLIQSFSPFLPSFWEVSVMNLKSQSNNRWEKDMPMKSEKGLFLHESRWEMEIEQMICLYNTREVNFLLSLWHKSPRENDTERRKGVIIIIVIIIMLPPSVKVREGDRKETGCLLPGNEVEIVSHSLRPSRFDRVDRESSFCRSHSWGSFLSKTRNPYADCPIVKWENEIRDENLCGSDRDRVSCVFFISCNCWVCVWRWIWFGLNCLSWWLFFCLSPPSSALSFSSSLWPLECFPFSCVPFSLSSLSAATTRATQTTAGDAIELFERDSVCRLTDECYGESWMDGEKVAREVEGVREFVEEKGRQQKSRFWRETEK